MEVVYENEKEGHYICVLVHGSTYEVPTFKKILYEYTPERTGYTTEKLVLLLGLLFTYVNAREVESVQQDLTVARSDSDPFTQGVYNKGITNGIF
ncbi:hypothetical protein [Staphylococcus phage vB_SauH_DELF3]|nr:hypothetical protein [Staphylococcus phage vB_SauH_DELF3]